jgi:hypothetical protein
MSFKDRVVLMVFQNRSLFVVRGFDPGSGSVTSPGVIFGLDDNEATFGRS